MFIANIKNRQIYNIIYLIIIYLRDTHGVHGDYTPVHNVRGNTSLLLMQHYAYPLSQIFVGSLDSLS